MNRVYEGDCLEVLTKFPDKCIDMVLCDLPYEITENKWDKCIDLPSLWYQYRRIIKPAGVIALTGQGRFTGKLIESNPDWFKYKIVWIKSKATNFLNANKQPLRRHEDICIFYQQQSIYNPQKIQAKPYDKGVRKDKGSGSYGKFNSSRSLNTDGKRFPTDVIAFEEESLTDWIFFKTAESEGVFHPVQKPVNLGRWLIQTYTVPGQIVLDNACGSGSFLVAAIMEKRQFIGIEKNDHSYHFGRKVDYVAITNKRIRLAFQEMNSRLSFD
ncbi:site-specific DNA-methyltransferase (adenine-specific)/modification methylase [Taibaiella chishuiensis]|uniref:Methyltransferase n=2 Tax=Taibaiella chishuiensis TaxID=1434707 RepID=A0A2P8D0N6_9BACT|nr:site-specific DNA-methyltransferase (adenine-specific)/modification methylase [Taibaiella chishuiensis]